MKKLVLLLCSLGLAIGCASQVSAFDKLVVFGDSLSDMGYQDKLGPLIHKSPLWTSPGGEAWPFYLAHDLNLPTITVNNSTVPLETNVYVSALGEGDDYAAGGAVTKGVGIGSSGYAPPSVHQQVLRYLTEHAKDDQSERLFVLWAGANDVSMALADEDPATTAIMAARQAADNVFADAILLRAHGARHVVIVNLPDLGSTPLALAQPALKPLLSAATDAFNMELSSQRGRGVLLFDAHGFFDALIANKETQVGGKTYRFDNVTEANCSGDIASISAINCVPPSRSSVQYLFEDGIHPTDAGHQVLAAKLASFISEQ